jgi:hypothetical protein
VPKFTAEDREWHQTANYHPDRGPRAPGDNFLKCEILQGTSCLQKKDWCRSPVTAGNSAR